MFYVNFIQIKCYLQLVFCKLVIINMYHILNQLKHKHVQLILAIIT